MSVRPWDVITFDCYGTLIDWEGGITAAFVEESARRGVATPSREQVVALHHEIEPTVEAGPFRPYRDVLATTARHIADRLGWPAGDDSFLPDSLSSWMPFADTNAALARLRSRGYRLGILSNVDRDLLEGTLKHVSVPFAFLVTAGDVRSYKPASGHFHEGSRRVGPERWLHAAQSWFHDVVPARREGVPVVWVNRKLEPLGSEARPTGVVRDLAGLVSWIDA